MLRGISNDVRMRSLVTCPCTCAANEAIVREALRERTLAAAAAAPAGGNAAAAAASSSYFNLLAGQHAALYVVQGVGAVRSATGCPHETLLVAGDPPQHAKFQ